MKKNILIFFSLFSNVLLAQYAPPAGVPGTTAMSRDSSAFIAWATGCSVARGLQDISNPSLGYASAGDSSMCIGQAGTGSVVSLGDGGSAIITFLHPVMNGPSWDFAIFENSFSDDFLELAFVEVSSDGINYHRFPAHSLTDTSVQTGSFDPTDATKINNLAGKYRAMFGTPFDLQELSGISSLDLNRIGYIKITDVVGCIQQQYASYDTAGRRINDPWPTPFASGGFDLDGVGVLHENPFAGIDELSADNDFTVYPNPCSASSFLSVYLKNEKEALRSVSLFNVQGIKVLSGTSRSSGLDLSGISPGIYFVEASSGHTTYRKKLIISQ
jgi:hypothetical protein